MKRRVSKLPGKVAAVDNSLQRLHQQAAQILPGLKERYDQMRQDPNASPMDLAQLGRAIGEYEQTVDRIRYGPHGAKGVSD